MLTCLRRPWVARFGEIDQGFEAGGGFFELHGHGIDGGDEELAIECVAFAENVDILPFSHEGFVHPLLAEIAQVPILAHLLTHLLEFEPFLLLYGLPGQFFGLRPRWLEAMKKESRPFSGMFPPGSLVISQGWGLIDLLLRATFSPGPPTGKYFSPALPSDCFAIDFP